LESSNAKTKKIPSLSSFLLASTTKRLEKPGRLA
jgi:hypothetical protein